MLEYILWERALTAAEIIGDQEIVACVRHLNQHGMVKNVGRNRVDVDKVQLTLLRKLLLKSAPFEEQNGGVRDSYISLLITNC
jgi:hypothetical protein